MSHKSSSWREKEKEAPRESQVLSLTSCGKQGSPEGWTAVQECEGILWDLVHGLEDSHESVLNNLNYRERREIRGRVFSQTI